QPFEARDRARQMKANFAGDPLPFQIATPSERLLSRLNKLVVAVGRGEPDVRANLAFGILRNGLISGDHQDWNEIGYRIEFEGFANAGSNRAIDLIQDGEFRLVLPNPGDGAIRLGQRSGRITKFLKTIRQETVRGVVTMKNQGATFHIVKSLQVA